MSWNSDVPRVLPRGRPQVNVNAILVVLMRHTTVASRFLDCSSGASYFGSISPELAHEYSQIIQDFAEYR